ncbi:MAG: uroporphyrinogen-III synthase [Acidobacteriota bacterium]|nr:uroporphyrinogen-III synthase [Acidobacteriota bacterium]
MDLYFTQIDPPEPFVIDRLKAGGWRCRHLPFRQVRLLEPRWDAAGWDVLLITSKQAARWLMRRTVTTLPRLGVVGRKTSALLPSDRLLFADAPADAAQLADRIRATIEPGSSLLFLRGEVAGDTLREKLAADYRFSELVVYQTTEIPQKGGAPSAGSMVYFQSPSSVSDYHALFKIRPAFVGVIGPSTARAVKQLGWTIDFQPGRPENRQLCEELPPARYFTSRERQP